MAYWFINTDEGARRDIRTCDLWFAYGMAFSGGDWKKYALPLQKIEPFDHCLMYHNRLGIVGVGRVIEKWDGKPHVSKLVYTNDSFSEYRLRVDWYLDLRTDPVDPRTEGLPVLPRFLKRIAKHEETAANLVSRLLCGREFRSPDEIEQPSGLHEGEIKAVTVDVHERNPVARRQCIEHWGESCIACGFTFLKAYGPIGDGYIHVHHLDPLSEISETRVVDPVKDLRPVCPNCHVIIHKKRPPYRIEEVKAFISGQVIPDPMADH